MIPPDRGALLRVAASVAIAAACIGSASLGQDPGSRPIPESRLIEDQPRIEIGRPPPVAPPLDLGPMRQPHPTHDDVRNTEHDSIDLDLDLREKRERRGDGESGASSWVAAAVFVAAGATLLLIIAWVRKRGGH